ncbi:leukotriene B4 receptor 1-like [Oreochromis aureus]|uniref:G-protein coupled receptors family 1 profile domain-containing protein n=1 Tax=Oreochromis aureus TaxID=47969 RepID=A0AAZ1XWG8_OREAU|nr:leukotriene B4 receptor 1-like [Oreochromis aureus]
MLWFELTGALSELVSSGYLNAIHITKRKYILKRFKSSSSMNNISVSFLTGPETTPDPDVENAVKNDYSSAIGALIFSLVFLLGVPGNLFIVWSILARCRQRSVTTLLILNLACADGFLMALSIFFIIFLALRTWVFGNAMCKIVFYLCHSNMYASVFLITLMSVNRLLAVVFPHTLYHLITRKVVRRVILGTWVLVMVMSIPSLVFRDVKEVTDDMNQTKYLCAPNHTLRRHVRFEYAFQTVAGFIIPYAIIITSYVLILKRLRETKFQRNIRSEKLILAIVIMFGLFWLPYHVVNLVQVAAEWYPKNSETRKRLHDIAELTRAVAAALSFISSCANPVLYTFAGKSYIKNNGFAFMAKLFEGTSSETETKATRFTAKDDLGKNNVDSENHTLASTLQNRC